MIYICKKGNVEFEFAPLPGMNAEEYLAKEMEVTAYEKYKDRAEYHDELKRRKENNGNNGNVVVQPEDSGSTSTTTTTVTTTTPPITDEIIIKQIATKYPKAKLIEIATELGIYNKSLTTEYKLITAILKVKPDFR